MILTDAGPLVALLDRGEVHHRACVACLADLAGPMVTTWPAFTEAMYLIGNAGGWPGQAALWRLVEQNDLEVAAPTPDQHKRMRVLMDKYQDLPMDLADASLVAHAEEHGLRDIFTLDRADFQTYRLHRRLTFRLWPRQLG
ncbi:MAG TPA: PIN domain-containing protein [Gemmataceae bacterium]|nr:PIN domain-containing protein [Gemmataceae bacterium]